ncbi:MAG TPA: magnesium transporter CorA family protein [Gaiellaceae bacterium]|nr:magnesium transporter CorA family protein [Gaiellaceae bacterium]
MSARAVVPAAAGAVAAAAPEALAERLRSGECFWLDIQDPGDDDYALLRETFGFHVLAVEDSEQFGQRPKADDYEDFVFLVVYGWSPDDDGLVEVHCFYAERHLVTVHRDPSPTLDALRAKLERDPDRFPEGPLLLHGVIDRLVDDLVPALQQLDEQLDAIEERVFARPTHEQLEEIFRIKRQLIHLRRVIVPQRELLARVTGGVVELPGMTIEAERHFRDVYDQLVRLAEEIDGDRELANSAIDAYLSTASNRLNATTKQLTVIATIFLPLSFLTGFFGQNFTWMVGEVSSFEAFLVFGIGLEVLLVIALVVLFRVRGWF